jgi:hypothetical protein
MIELQVASFASSLNFNQMWNVGNLQENSKQAVQNSLGRLVVV